MKQQKNKILFTNTLKYGKEQARCIEIKKTTTIEQLNATLARLGMFKENVNLTEADK